VLIFRPWYTKTQRTSLPCRIIWSRTYWKIDSILREQTNDSHSRWVFYYQYMHVL